MRFFLKHRAYTAYFSFSVASSGLGFGASLFMLRLMPPEEFGRIALFMSLLFITTPIISFAADNVIAINKAKLSVIDYEHFRRSFVTFAYLMFLVVQLVFFALFPLGLLHDYLLLLIPVYGLIQFLINMASIEYVMEEKPVQYGMVAFSTSLVSLLLTILLLTWISGAADWRIAALLLSNIIFLCVRYWKRFTLLWTFSVDQQVFKNVAVFGFPLLLSLAPAWALNESDKIIVAKYANMAAVGYYSAACAVGGIMITFNAAMLNAITPKIYQALYENPGEIILITKRFAREFLGISASFGCLFALLYVCLADFILPEKYAGARPIVYVVILFSLGRALYAVLGLVTDYYGMTIVKLKGIIYGGITTVVTSIFGVIQFGVIGAAVGVGLGYLVLSLVLWNYLVKKANKQTKSYVPICGL